MVVILATKHLIWCVTVDHRRWSCLQQCLPEQNSRKKFVWYTFTLYTFLQKSYSRLNAWEATKKYENEICGIFEQVMLGAATPICMLPTL